MNNITTNLNPGEIITTDVNTKVKVGIADKYDFGQKLRDETAAVRMHLPKFGVTKRLEKSQKQTMADVYGASGDAITAGKKLVDTQHPAYKAVTSVQGNARKLWIALTVPHPESGYRLIRKKTIEQFDVLIGDIKIELESAILKLDSHYEHLLECAKDKLGELYNAADYPATLIGEFEISVDYPPIDPPEYLKQLNPKLYEREVERVRGQFNTAVKLAEAAFLEEFSKLVSHLCDKLSGDEDGKKKVFRNSALTNINEFVERFRELNIGNNGELDSLVETVEKLVDGVSPGDLRGDELQGQIVGKGMADVARSLDEMMVEAPKRMLRGFNNE